MIEIFLIQHTEKNIELRNTCYRLFLPKLSNDFSLRTASCRRKRSNNSTSQRSATPYILRLCPWLNLTFEKKKLKTDKYSLDVLPECLWTVYSFCYQNCVVFQLVWINFMLSDFNCVVFQLVWINFKIVLFLYIWKKWSCFIFYLKICKKSIKIEIVEKNVT